MPAPFTILADGSLRLRSGNVIGDSRSSPFVVQSVAAQCNWNADTSVSLDFDATLGNLLVVVFGSCNQPDDPAITWYDQPDGWTGMGDAGGESNVRRQLTWALRPVVDGDTDSIPVGAVGDQTGTDLSGVGTCCALYELSGCDMTGLPSSAVAGTVLTYDPNSGDPTSGFATESVVVPGGGLALCAAIFTSATAADAVPGPGANPAPVAVTTAQEAASSELVLATYTIDVAGVTPVVGEIDGPVANSGNKGTAELLVVFQGPLVGPGQVAALIAGEGIDIDPSVPTRPVISVLLTDQSDGHTYRIISTAGVLSTEEVT